MTGLAKSYSPLSAVTLATLQANLPKWQEQHRKKKEQASKGEPSVRFLPRQNLPKRTAEWFADLCPHLPHPKQKQFLDCTAREALFGGGGGGGKMLSLDTLVPTPTGWTTMGALKAGDLLFDENGQVTQVVIAHPVELNPESYRVEFDDGTVVLACADHLWFTQTVADRRRFLRSDPEWKRKRRETRTRRCSGKKSARFTESLALRNAERAARAREGEATQSPQQHGGIRNTKEIAATLCTRRGEWNHAVPIAGALELPEAILPVDPYLLGAWLGDGTSLAGSVTTKDEEIRVAFAGAYTASYVTPGQCATYGFRGLRPELRALGVFGNKHIPQRYLRASREQRLALLQGLMDTDGTVCDGGSVEFTTTNQRLAEGTHELISSLGWRARLVESRATLYGKDCGPKWDIKWTPSDVVFRLERKKRLQKLATHPCTKRRYIVKCERIPPVPMRCITVAAASGLYLVTRSMVPTHNTDGALMRLLKWVDIPGYAGLALRVNFAQMMKSDAILARAIEWWAGKPQVKYDMQKHMFKFSCPGGGTSEISFGHMDSAQSHFDYQGMAAQQVIFDELTHFQQKQYTYLFSRQRKPTTGPASQIPLFMGATANPGGTGHRWVYDRFINPETRRPHVVWIPSTVDDNPSVDLVSYEESLAELDPVTREQLRHGSWEELAPGDFFDQTNFVLIDEPPPRIDGQVRFWDFASSDESKKKRSKKGPDFTASCRMGFIDERGDPARGIPAFRAFYVLDATEDLWAAGVVPTNVGLQAKEDSISVAVRWEEEGGSSGQIASERAIKPELLGHDADGIRSTGSKMERAKPYSAQVAKHRVFVLKRHWTKKWLEQHHSFPMVDHDDQVDAAAGAFNYLQTMRAGVPVNVRQGPGITGSLGVDRYGKRVRPFR